jgi:hypothetical protein
MKKIDDLIKNLQRHDKVKRSPAFRGTRRAVPLQAGLRSETYLGGCSTIPRSAGQMDFFEAIKIAQTQDKGGK